MALSRPPLYTVPLNWFPFSFISPGEIISSRAVATQNKVFPRWNSTRICWRGEVLLREHQKSTWTMNRKPCLCATGAHARAVGPGRAARTNCSEAAKGRAMWSPGPWHPKTPPKAKIWRCSGISLESIFYQSCLIFFNKSVLFKWLMIVRILPRA